MIAFKFIVQGRVQGVGFRWFVKSQADKLKITGTVRNLSNGDVEIIAQAQTTEMYKFIDQVKNGPALSRVDNLKQVSINLNDEFTNFKVIN